MPRAQFSHKPCAALPKKTTPNLLPTIHNENGEADKNYKAGALAPSQLPTKRAVQTSASKAVGPMSGLNQSLIRGAFDVISGSAAD
jgi:hypothetical protein